MITREQKEEALSKDQPSKNERPYLIVGCGHGCKCSHSHPESLFVTVDMNPLVNPELCWDVKQAGFKEHVVKNYKKFNAIFFEYSGVHDLSDLLNEDGCAIYLGNSIDTIIKLFGNSHNIWVMTNEASNDTVVIISKSKSLKLNSDIFSYLQPELQNYPATFHKLNLVPELLNRINLLDDILYPHLRRLFLLALFSDEKPVDRMTAGMLKSVVTINDYSYVGLFTSKICSLFSGTDANIEKFLAQFDDEHVFKDKQLIQILHEISGELYKLKKFDHQYKTSYINTDSDRYRSLKKLAMTILNYYLSKHSLEKQNELEAKSDKKTFHA